MIPAAFDYQRASSAEEAISLIGQHGDDAACRQTAGQKVDLPQQCGRIP